ncbi:MAG: PCYCGC motif-containing lipoprotein [Bacteroidetes bacterium]|nr:PCYCGC motif-containing lipoprotein [Bacteroidota bacterium]MDA1333383.1 PCYCGC motif-containing lipoprotein [Bacteroidota bacterium]
MKSRRDFVKLTLGGLGLSLVPAKVFARFEHPEPREGIDASLVVSDEFIKGLSDETKEVVAMIREIPHLADGIGCHCGCHVRPGYRSLLTCFYEDGRGIGCPICQGEVKLAYRRNEEGQTLDQIRRAIDARFG